MTVGEILLCLIKLTIAFHKGYSRSRLKVCEGLVLNIISLYIPKTIIALSVYTRLCELAGKIDIATYNAMNFAVNRDG